MIGSCIYILKKRKKLLAEQSGRANNVFFNLKLGIIDNKNNKNSQLITKIFRGLSPPIDCTDIFLVFFLCVILFFRRTPELLGTIGNDAPVNEAAILQRVIRP